MIEVVSCRRQVIEYKTWKTYYMYCIYSFEGTKIMDFAKEADGIVNDGTIGFNQHITTYRLILRAFRNERSMKLKPIN